MKEVVLEYIAALIEQDGSSAVFNEDNDLEVIVDDFYWTVTSSDGDVVT